MKKAIIYLISIGLSIYVLFCTLFYFFQEKLIFYPEKLDRNYSFSFKQSFEEMNIDTYDNTILNGLLFKSGQSKGLIFYLHGNAGSLKEWGKIAPVYTSLGYDIFFLDYRGYGKSSGNINSQEELFDDLQLVYNKLLKRYNENSIIVLGYSIGTCPATMLASNNEPRLLILQAPYHDLTGVIQGICPIVPSFTIRYKLETYRYLKDCKMPVVVFHGDKDNVIDYSNSLRLKEELKNTDTLITLKEEGHNTITESKVYRERLAELLQ